MNDIAQRQSYTLARLNCKYTRLRIERMNE